MADEPNDFLTEMLAEDGVMPPSESPPEPPPPPKVEAAEPKSEASTEAPAETPEPEDDPAHTVPVSVLTAARKDYKTQLAVTQEQIKQRDAELERLRADLAAAKTAPVPPPQQSAAPFQIPNPATHPAEWNAYQEQRMETLRLDQSEATVRRVLGNDVVDAAFAKYREAIKDDPSLHARTMAARDPWGAMVDEAKKIDARREAAEIAKDPAAYRDRIIAEHMATMNTPPAPAAQPRAQLPTSLAGARSAAPRQAAAWTGPTPFEDIFKN